MNAAETSASKAIADWMVLTEASRSSATAVIDTFMIEVSTTSTNIAIARSAERRPLPVGPGGAPTPGPVGSSAIAVLRSHRVPPPIDDERTERLAAPRPGQHVRVRETPADR